MTPHVVWLSDQQRKLSAAIEFHNDSYIRLDIARRFREAGIIVADPQRNMHLDTVGPLEICVVRPSAGERSRAA